MDKWVVRLITITIMKTTNLGKAYLLLIPPQAPQTASLPPYRAWNSLLGGTYKILGEEENKESLDAASG